MTVEEMIKAKADRQQEMVDAAKQGRRDLSQDEQREGDIQLA